MIDERLRDAYQEHLQSPTDRAACASPEALRALVERVGPEGDRLRTLDHVMSCTACRKEFDLLMAVAATRPEGRRWLPILAAAAVFVAVGAGVWVAVQPRDSGDQMRGAADSVGLIAPDAGATMDSAAALVWHAVPEANRYTVEILDQEGRAAWTADTRDTSITVPVAVISPGEYRWWVRGVLRDGTQAASTLRPFRLRQRP